MRILVITDLYPPVAFGGYERQCAALVDGLSSRGHDVAVLTSDLDRESVETVRFVRRTLPYVGGDSPDRQPGEESCAAAVTREVLAEFQPELVYVSSCAGVPHPAPWAAARTGLPTVHRLSELCFASSLYRGDAFPAPPVQTAISWCSQDLRACVSLSPALEVALEHVIYPGSVDGETLKTMPRRPSRPVTILFLGRVTLEKGADVACYAIGHLRRIYGFDARLILAGPCRPDVRARLEALARERGIDSAVELHGPAKTSDVHELLQQAHAIVIPSVGHEAFGSVCIEAGLARVPIVASRNGGLREALNDGEHALLFRTGDARACAKALAATLNDPLGTRERVQRAFRRMSEFSLERYVRESEAFILEAHFGLSSPVRVSEVASYHPKWKSGSTPPNVVRAPRDRQRVDPAS